MNKFSNGLEKSCEVFSVVLFAALTVIVFIEVMARYFLNASSPGREEVSRHLFILGSFVVAGVCWKKDKHISIDLLQRHVGRRAKIAFSLVFQLFGLFTSVLWLWCCILLVRKELTVLPTHTEVLRIPWSVLYSFLTLTMAVLVYYVVERLVKFIRSPSPPEPH